MKIRTRAYLLGMLPAILIASIIGSYLIINRINDLDAALKERGNALSRYLVQGAEYAVVTGDQESLKRILDWVVKEQDVAHVGVYRPNGEAIAEAGHMPGDIHVSFQGGILESRKHLVFSMPIVLTPLAITDPFQQGQALSSPRTIAWVQLSISREGNVIIARNMLLATLGIIVLGLLFTTILVRKLALIGVRPLMEMIAAVREIAAGNLHIGKQLPLTAKSELRDLQQGINTMSEALISYQEDMQQRVDTATAELTLQKEAAEKANQAKSHFLAAASHDLRQPMHALGMYVASLKSQLHDHKSAATLNKVEASVSAMESMFNAILDVSKLEAGVVTPDISPVSAKGLLVGLHEEFSHEASARNLELRLHCKLEEFVNSDPVLLARILRNLICNALRYTKQGGVLIAARRREEHIRFQVWDTGLGIPPEHIKDIFQEFFQLSNPQRDRSQGLGLGLAIADRLARLMGHTLTVHSLPGRGSMFSLDVPISHVGALAKQEQAESLEDLTRLQGLVAVVDDDAMVADSLANLLEGWGLQVIMAHSKSELLAKLTSAPAILITDYRLKGEDGLQVADAMREAYPEARFQVIVITGDTSSSSVLDLAASSYPVLHKPVRPASLRTLVSRLLKSSGSAGKA
jgi:signal transduction histidine kinase